MGMTRPYWVRNDAFFNAAYFFVTASKAYERAVWPG